MKKSFNVKLIGSFYMCGAFVLFLTLGIKQDIGMNVRLGVPFLPETIVQICLAMFFIFIGYGCLRMKKWGYRAVIIYSILFLIVSLKQLLVYHNQLFLNDLVLSLIMMAYMFSNKYSFI